MTNSLSSVLLVFALLAASASAAPVVINEIHYHPASEDVREEYIELLNIASTNVNLAGWSFSDGIDFTFPDVTLPPGGLLVVAADLATFSSNHPGVVNVVGNWTGQLSNSDEDIDLDNAAGERVDSVHYADKGDWAVRQVGPLDEMHRGWVWMALHDGGGKALELINPHQSNNSGQNWGSSLSTNGTPGVANSIAQPDVAPLILDVQHLPVIPRSIDNVLVMARLKDEAASGITATVHWRVDGASSFTVLPMHDDGFHEDGIAGDGIFAAFLPGQPADTVVEFYIKAVDSGLRSRTWPAPALNENGALLGQVANALYQVDDSTYDGPMPLYKLIMTDAERQEIYDIGHGARYSNDGESQSNAQMNGTFISIDGTGTELRYTLGIRNRGNSSRNQQPNSYRVNFNSDQRWKEVKALNLNGQFSHSQIIGAVLSLKSGLPAAESRPVQVRVNNANLGNNGPETYGGAYAANESIGSDWAAHRLPGDSSGNAYRVTYYVSPSEFNYRGEDPAAYTNTYAKSTNESEDNWTDLIGMLRIMGTNDLFTAEAVKSVIHVEEWMTYLAVNALVNNRESSPNTGYNDDYYQYGGVNDPRFLLIPHDFDEIIGGNTASTIFGALGTGPGTFDMTPLFDIPEFEDLYHQTMEDLLNTTFSKAEFDATLNQTLGTFVPASVINDMIAWMDARRTYVQGVIDPHLAGITNAPVATVTGEPRSPTGLSSATLTVGGSSISEYRYALNNGSFGVATPVASPITLSGLANGTNYVRVIGADSNGVWQAEAAATLSDAWVVDAAWPAVRINEVIAENVSAFSHAGTFPDAIELYNEGSATVNLAGMRLSDKPDSPDKFFFPSGTTLAPGAYLVVLANDPDGTPGLHTGFSLKQGGEGVYLFDTAANGGTLLDSVAFGLQLPDYSIGRVDSGEFVLTQPSFGSANTAQPLADENNLCINEWLAVGFSLVPDDFIELYNPEALPAALGGLYLTDNPVGEKAMHRITPHSFLGAEGFLAFTADSKPNKGADHLNFKLAGEQGLIALLSADLETIDCVPYGPQRTDISQGRTPDGAAAFDFFALPSPGAANPFTVVNVQTETILEMTNAWHYYQAGSLDGVNWTDPSFDDSAWLQGPALLYVEGAGLPAPKNTPLSLGSTTFYFRSRFTFSGDPAATVIHLSTIVDDGCVVHLNGAPVHWLRFTAGATPVYADLTETFVDNAVVEGPFAIPGSALVQGDNVIAVEVHQSSAGSSDVVFGLQLDLVTSDPDLGLVLNEVLAVNRSQATADGRTPDWVEILNTGAGTVELADMSLSDDPAVPRKWVFPASASLGGGERLVIECDNALPASPTNTGFGFSASGDSVLLYDTLAEGGVLLDSLAFGLQVPDFSLSRIPEGGGEWTLGLPTRSAANVAAATGIESQLRINEWMANPADGDDWFELYNPNPQPVGLGGLSLTDDPSNRNKSPLLPLSFIAPTGFAKMIADNNAGAGGDHVDFGLGASGDFIALYRATGTQVDGLAFGPQARGVSEGRFLDGAYTVVAFPGTASPGTENYLPHPDIVISELLAHTDPPLEDAVEVHNLGAAPVDLGGWYLSDSTEDPRKFVIPAGTTVDAGGYTVFYEHQFVSNGLPGVVTPFSFNSAHGGEVLLSQTDAGTNLVGFRASEIFGASANGVSFGRFATSLDHEFTAMSARTFGEDQPSTLAQFRAGTGGTNADPLVGPVVFSEILFRPSTAYGGTDFNAGEYIELHNPGPSAVPLYDPAAPTNAWRIDGGVEFDFPSGMSVPPTGAVIVVGFDPVSDTGRAAWFDAQYSIPPGVDIVGPWSGSLADEGESLQLYRPDPPQLPPQLDAGFVPQILVERVVYQPADPWPSTGAGDALQRRDSEIFGNEPLNWFGALPSGGMDNLADSDDDGLPDYWELENGLDPNSASGDNGASGNLDGDPLTNLEEWLAGTRANDALDYLRIVSIDTTPGSTLIRFRAAAGRTYIVSAAENLASGLWNPVAEAPRSANDADVEIVDPSATNHPARFYRVDVKE